VPSKEDETQAKHYKSQLSVGALDALKEFYGERDTRQKQFEDLKSQAENDFDGKKLLSMEAFTEDWNASQFWVSFIDSRKILLTTAQYSDETAATLAEQLLDGATDETCIAVVSAPSSFIQLKNLVVSAFLEPLRSSYKSLKSLRF
jgi:hypothetical protein